MNLDATQMSAPVTRGELKAELDQRLAEIEQKFDDKLGLWAGALSASLTASLSASLTASLSASLGARIEASEQRMLAELARHARALEESMAARFSAFDDKYADLPPRVNRLEATVFKPKRR